jgi:hypothetical protein
LRKNNNCNKIINNYSLINNKKIISHNHNKSLYNQNTEIFNHFIKKMNNSESAKFFIKNNDIKDFNKNSNKKNLTNYNKRYHLITNYNTNLNKAKKNRHKKEIKNNLIIHHLRSESSDKGGFAKIIRELKINRSNDNIINRSINKDNTNHGLSKKFIVAQDNWRKNYFATVIQKIFRGYQLRKSDYKKNFKIQYILKKELKIINIYIVVHFIIGNILQKII